MGHVSSVQVPPRARGHRVAPWLLGSALFVAGCAESAPLDAYELTGRVTVFNEGVDPEPVPNAAVSFVSDTLVITETEADASGRYRMVVLTDTPFGQVRATAEGFQAGETTVFFDVPQRRVDLALRRAPGG